MDLASFGPGVTFGFELGLQFGFGLEFGFGEFDLSDGEIDHEAESVDVSSRPSRLSRTGATAADVWGSRGREFKSRQPDRICPSGRLFGWSVVGPAGLSGR